MGRVKIEKGTLSEGSNQERNKDGFVVEFVGRIGAQPGKTQTIEDTKFGRVRIFVE